MTLHVIGSETLLPQEEVVALDQHRRAYSAGDAHVSPTDLKLERLKRVENNADISPRDLMTLVIDAMDEGFDGDPSRAIVIIETKKADGTYGIETFRAGCSRYEEIALSALHQATQIEKWRT